MSQVGVSHRAASHRAASNRVLPRAALVVASVFVVLVSLMSPVAAHEGPATESNSTAGDSTESAIPPEASAQDGEDPVVEVRGHGWGHGRGLSQYGAYGYAEQGWTSAQILDHYYGGSTAGSIDSATLSLDPNQLRVDLRKNQGFSTRVDVQNGSLRVMDGTELIYQTAADSRQAVRLRSSGAGLSVESAPSCSGPWTLQANLGATTLRVERTSTGDTPDDLLRVCNADSSSNWYEGTIQSYNNNGSTRTINVVSVEQYLRGVVPRESPASWPAAALEAQAVAARSYALAGDARQLPYADTCDTTLCQVYEGRYRQLTEFEIMTHPATDAAIAATAGLVRLFGTTVARTEFSSSSGGYTAGGDFTAVPDEGDSIAANPNHDWIKTVNLAAFEASQNLPNDGKPNLGDLLSVEVITRNGLGEDGGRALTVLFEFANGSITKTGNETRQLLSLKSDWFSFGPIGQVSTSPEASAYINHVFELFLGRSATVGDRSDWLLAIQTGQREDLTTALALTDEWAGVMIDGFYQDALGRSADPEGKAHWLAQVAAGVRVEAVGAHFYGSPEYYARSGGTDESFVRALYRDLLGREAEPEGLVAWVQRLSSGEMTTGDVASGFYASIESRKSRVSGLYQRILLREPDASGLEYWAEELLRTDDVRLASQLAASGESFEIAQRP